MYNFRILLLAANCRDYWRILFKIIVDKYTWLLYLWYNIEINHGHKLRIKNMKLLIILTGGEF